MSSLPFHNRSIAGSALAKELKAYAGKPDTMILALVRGGVVVGRALADALALPLYPFAVRKIGHPMHREFGLGAIAGEGAMYLDEITLVDHGFTEEHLKPIIEEERHELERRRKLYSPEPLPSFKDQTIILTDDGAATGSSVFAAVEEIRKSNPVKIVVALPLCAPDTAEKIRKKADEIVILETPSPFNSVGQWYSEFPQVEDKEVLALLK